MKSRFVSLCSVTILVLFHLSFTEVYVNSNLNYRKRLEAFPLKGNGILVSVVITP